MGKGEGIFSDEKFRNLLDREDARRKKDWKRSDEIRKVVDQDNPRRQAGWVYKGKALSKNTEGYSV